MPARLHHPALVVPDLDAARNFYCDLLGFDFVKESTWDGSNKFFNQIVALDASAARFCLLRGENCYLELFEYATPSSNANPKALAANDFGIRHLSFEVDDVSEAFNRLRELGGLIMNEPVSADGRPVGVYCRRSLRQHRRIRCGRR